VNTDEQTTTTQNDTAIASEQATTEQATTKQDDIASEQTTSKQNDVAVAPAAEAAAAVDPLDELKDIDFLLEDIEDQIAPVALG
jgi:hypothetical protein